MNQSVELVYKNPELSQLNAFIRVMNSLYKLSLNELSSFFAEKPMVLSGKIILTQPEIKAWAKTEPKERVDKPVKAPVLVDVDNELLKDYALYTPDVFKIEKKDFYLDRQYGFMDSVHSLLEDLYNEDDEVDSCDKSSDFIMLKHQKIVQSYLNSYTPYRGLLLYHGLGSGKTCSSIGILEGMKHDKKIFILTPASLQENYRNQMSFCGDKLFKTKHHWKKVKHDSEMVFQLFKDYLFLDHDRTLLESYMKKHKGIWLIEEDRPNYESLKEEDKQQIQELIRVLISMKYNFINYNGVNKKSWEKMKQVHKTNPFHNSVIVVDEAHNFISRINNKLMAGQTSVSTDMYESIMDAQNCKVVLLSGTPYINAPSELGIMINLVSGYTTEYEIILTKKYELKILKDALRTLEDYNRIDYKLDRIYVVRNPYGFVATSTGEVRYENPALYVDTDFKDVLQLALKSIPIKQIHIHKYKRIPDEEKEFNSLFVQKQGGLRVINNKEFFQTRIAGLISYLGDKTSLMPRLEPMRTEIIPMSSHQKKEYEQYKKKESTKSDQKDGSYKVFTRAACNFVFDNDIKRPFPDFKKMTEDDFDYIQLNDRLKRADGVEEDGDRVLNKGAESYDSDIKTFLKKVSLNRNTLFFNELLSFVSKAFDKPNEDSEMGLMKYSPKFHSILEHIIRDRNTCQLLYSSFRRIEGIEMMRQLLKYQGFRELVLVKTRAGSYTIELDGIYPETSYTETRVFALYTGTEEKEEKEIIRNIYNSDLSKLSPAIQTRLKDLYKETDNLHGSLINVLMITSSGAEGIDLQNVRYVHITEPYWHNVRLEQVIGRARRICSHNRLDKEEQNVQVYLYISSIKEDKKDISTDEFLLKIMEEKKVLAESFLSTLKESAIDCLPSKQKCFKFPKNNKKDKDAYALDYKKAPVKKKVEDNLFVEKELLFNGVSTLVVIDYRTTPPKVFIKETGEEIGVLNGNQII